MSGSGFILWSLLALIVSTLIPFTAEQMIGHPAANAAALHGWAVISFLVDLAFVTAVVMGFGAAVTGRAFGIAMTGWNDYSLSKLQMALWTIVVLAGLLTSAKLNLLDYFAALPDAADPARQAGQPLAIAIPPELLAAMGIAAFSTAATPAILALKSGQSSTAGQVAAAQQRLVNRSGADGGTVQNTGKAAGFVSANSASWLDLVTGDEVANSGIVDLSKVQQLLVTLLLLGTYVIMLARGFAHASVWIDALPPLDEHFVELMALSHASYLVYKATPKSSQGAPPAA